MFSYLRLTPELVQLAKGFSWLLEHLLWGKKCIFQMSFPFFLWSCCVKSTSSWACIGVAGRAHGSSRHQLPRTTLYMTTEQCIFTCSTRCTKLDYGYKALLSCFQDYCYVNENNYPGKRQNPKWPRGTQV